MRRLAIITSWLLAGHAMWLAVFWGLLQVPESSAWMLVLSGVLVLMLIVMAGALHAGASAAWDLTRPVRAALLHGIWYVPAALAAGVLFGAIWWLTGAVLDWHTGIAGQIDAWYIARTGRTDSRWIHFAIFWATMFVRWSVGLTLASSLLGSLTTINAAALKDVAWFRSALAPARWLAITFWFVLLVALPWQVVDWRPARISVGAELWFVGAKLAVIAVAMAVGWALVLRRGHGAAEKT
jgi:hypothetical protein